MKLKLAKVGNSTGIVLPQELLARLCLELGDTVYLTETRDGVRLTTSNPDNKTAAVETIMHEDRDVLRGLAH